MNKLEEILEPYINSDFLLENASLFLGDSEELISDINSMSEDEL